MADIQHQIAARALDAANLDAPAPPPAAPPVFPTTPCDSCKAPIVWAHTRAGKPMPVDADPVDPVTGGGNITLQARPAPMPPLAIVHGKPAVELRGARWAWRPHFATCPYAGRHRRRNRVAGPGRPRR